jgi:BTB/POZ domain-containing protein KCTD9
VSRLSYEDSCKRLQDGGHLAEGQTPVMPGKMPQADDEAPLGVEFFRTFVGDGADLSNLTLPRTFFGRSEITNVRLRNTDLTESNLCWNDFTDVDFDSAILIRCDLRASTFKKVRFTSTNIAYADMRLSSFENCDFTDARMDAVILTRDQGSQLSLSPKQRAVIAWTDEDGPEPSGG